MKLEFSGWKPNLAEEGPSECEDRLQQTKTIDESAWLVNCHGLPDMVESEIKRSKRSGRSFAILVCALNGMKSTNDCHNHLAIDRALCRLVHIFAFPVEY
jgi:GGDEF domain-containing protein